MPQSSAQVTAAEISRIAGVTRATVSNWRRRHEDFPAPSGGTDSSPLYDLESVRAWLSARGHVSAATPAEELRTTLRLRAQSGGSGAPEGLLLLVLAAAGHSPEELTAFTESPDAALIAQAQRDAATAAESVPAAGPVRFGAGDTPVLRANSP